MGLLEAAVVIYMRYLYYPEDPLQIFPMRFLDAYDTVLELCREAATVVMIVSVAALAERRNKTLCFAAFVFVFGVWDLFYYVWLKVLLGWPVAWLEWDVLFLIPSVWLGPWICPSMIAVLFVVWGAIALRSDRVISFKPWDFAVFLLGALIGLIAFLEPALSVLRSDGIEALSQYTPDDFQWGTFVAGWLLMGIGLWMTLRSGVSIEGARSNE